MVETEGSLNVDSWRPYQRQFSTFNPRWFTEVGSTLYKRRRFNLQIQPDLFSTMFQRRHMMLTQLESNVFCPLAVPYVLQWGTCLL